MQASSCGCSDIALWLADHKLIWFGKLRIKIRVEDCHSGGTWPRNNYKASASLVSHPHLSRIDHKHVSDHLHHAYIHAHIHAPTPTPTPTQHTQTPTHPHSHTHTHSHTTHPHIHTHAHAHAHPHTPTPTHTPTHPHTHSTHMRTPTLKHWGGQPQDLATDTGKPVRQAQSCNKQVDVICRVVQHQGLLIYAPGTFFASSGSAIGWWLSPTTKVKRVSLPPRFLLTPEKDERRAWANEKAGWRGVSNYMRLLWLTCLNTGAYMSSIYGMRIWSCTAQV